MDWPPDAVRRDDLDEEYARRTFMGKSFDEAVEMFSENVLMRSEDVSYMPPIPFRFYMLAFKTHVSTAVQRAYDYDPSDAASSLLALDASTAADTFLRLINRTLESEPDWIVPIMPELLPAVHLLEMNQERYGASQSTYGDFHEVGERIRMLWDTRRGHRA